MSRDEILERCPRIEEAYEFDAPPERVWRAVTTPEIRARWLPDAALASPEPLSTTPGRDVSYRMRESVPPFLESTVTFRLEPREAGGTRLRILHELTDARLASRRPANRNSGAIMRAAA